ncbi:MAG: hypothetical protein IPH42_04410 [Bacteroidetes bacterium]|nr:hypothetical protein [Bacteroidota bacterium]
MNFIYLQLNIFSANLWIRKYLIYIPLIGLSSLNGQNLIENGDFEMYSTCPFETSQISYAENWFDQLLQLLIILICAIQQIQFLCQQILWVISQHNQGNAYAGIFIAQTGGPIYREYIETGFKSTLVAGCLILLHFMQIFRI